MKKNLRGIIAVAICVALCLGYYYYLSYRNRDKEPELTEVEMVISKELDTSYPKTVREVVKFFNRIVMCYYTEEYSDSQLKRLTGQARKLMDEDLQAQNPEDKYLDSVKQDVLQYKEEGREITSVTLERAEDIEYKTADKTEYAYVDVSYYIKEKKGANRANQTYILRKNKDGRWKILGFYQPQASK